MITAWKLLGVSRKSYKNIENQMAVSYITKIYEKAHLSLNFFGYSIHNYIVHRNSPKAARC